MAKRFEVEMYMPEEIRQTLAFTYEKRGERDVCVAFDRRTSYSKESTRFVLSREQALKLYNQLGAALIK